MARFVTMCVRCCSTPKSGGAVGAVLDAGAVRSVWERFEQRETSWSRPWALYAVKVWGERHL